MVVVSFKKKFRGGGTRSRKGKRSNIASFFFFFERFFVFAHVVFETGAAVGRYCTQLMRVFLSPIFIHSFWFVFPLSIVIMRSVRPYCCALALSSRWLSVSRTEQRFNLKEKTPESRLGKCPRRCSSELRETLSPPPGPCLQLMARRGFGIDIKSTCQRSSESPGVRLCLPSRMQVYYCCSILLLWTFSPLFSLFENKSLSCHAQFTFSRSSRLRHFVVGS